MSNSTQAKQGATQAPNKTTDAPTTEKVRDVAHDAIDGAAARAEPLERRIRDGASEAQDKFHEKKDAAAAQMEDSLASIESFIKARPMTAAGIAFAAGILASRLMRS